jgi:hypothetical protein
MDARCAPSQRALGRPIPRQELVLKIEPDGNDGVRFWGEFSYAARFDGKQYNRKNSHNDTVQLQLVDAHTVDFDIPARRSSDPKDTWVVSADGRQMTLTTTGTFETGQYLTEKVVFQKQ